MQSMTEKASTPRVPEWVPQEVRRYLAHTEQGQSARSLAREAGCHASTILRQLRRYDFLMHLALSRLGLAQGDESAAHNDVEYEETMALGLNTQDVVMPDYAGIRAEAPRVFRRMN
jgi:hypothetical protein